VSISQHVNNQRGSQTDTQHTGHQEAHVLQFGKFRDMEKVRNNRDPLCQNDAANNECRHPSPQSAGDQVAWGEIEEPANIVCWLKDRLSDCSGLELVRHFARPPKIADEAYLSSAYGTVIKDKYSQPRSLDAVQHKGGNCL
jgi:hypothetical protein